MKSSWPRSPPPAPGPGRAGHRPPPARPLHPRHPRRSVRGQPTHHRQRRTRSRAAAGPGRIQPRTRPDTVRHRNCPARLPDITRRRKGWRSDTSRLILYESTAPATSWPKCPRTPRPGSRPTTGRSSRCPPPSSPGRPRSGPSRTGSTASPAAGATPIRRRVRCLLDGRDNLTVYLRFPREHWNRIRHSNFIERTFGETRRRVKVIGRLPGEHSCTSLVWAVLDRASRGWRGFTMTPAGLRLLHDLRRALFDPPTPLAGAGDPATETGAELTRSA